MPSAGIHTWLVPWKPDDRTAVGVFEAPFLTVVGFAAGTAAFGRTVHPAGIGAKTGRAASDAISAAIAASTRSAASAATGSQAAGATGARSSPARWRASAADGAPTATMLATSKRASNDRLGRGAVGMTAGCRVH